MTCKKCNLAFTVTLRKKDYYCNDCFIISTNHKFRACLGKNKVLSPNENILICLSGGAGSTVLLDLVLYGISLENTKKLRIVPFFLHLTGDEENNNAKFVIEQCKKYNCEVYVVHLSDYLNTSHCLPEVNSIPNIEQNVASQFNCIISNMTPTARNDFILKIKQNLFIEYAKQLHCNIIFTAETNNTLAISLLSNLALGRGSQIQNDIGFADIRDEKVKIIRPMKDISKEELDYYLTIKLLPTISDASTSKDNSLQSVISTFICDLQENFQSTVSTVCRTADKIGNFNEDKNLGKCYLCKSNLNTQDLKMSALEATNISRTVSFGKSNPDQNTDLTNIFDNDTHTAVFPLVNKYLCYGCSRNNSEINADCLPQGLQEILHL